MLARYVYLLCDRIPFPIKDGGICFNVTLIFPRMIGSMAVSVVLVPKYVKDWWVLPPVREYTALSVVFGVLHINLLYV